MKTAWVARMFRTDSLSASRCDYMLFAIDPVRDRMGNRTYWAGHFVQSFCPAEWHRFTSLRLRPGEKCQIELPIKIRRKK